MDLLVLLRVKILFMYLSPHSIKDWKILEILLLFLLSGVIEKLKNLYMKDKSIQIMELNLCQGYNQDSGTSRWKGTIPNHSDSWLVCSLDENSTVEPETRMQVLGEQQEAKARPHTRRTHSKGIPLRASHATSQVIFSASSTALWCPWQGFPAGRGGLCLSLGHVVRGHGWSHGKWGCVQWHVSEFDFDLWS